MYIPSFARAAIADEGALVKTNVDPDKPKFNTLWYRGQSLAFPDSAEFFVCLFEPSKSLPFLHDQICCGLTMPQRYTLIVVSLYWEFGDVLSPPGPGVTVIFLTTVFLVRNLAERDSVLIVKGNRGCVMFGHVFLGKLYFTKDLVDDSFVPRNRKPKGIPKPAAKPAPKPAPEGKHVQLFKMRRKVGKGFYSTASDAPDGQ